jgi:hypothetical protein
MALPFVFANVSTLATPALDANYNALGALTPIPCVVSGTNDITLTPLTNTPTVAAYSNYMQFTGIAAGTNTTTVTATVGALATLPVYKASVVGPVALVGGEITASCSISLLYDSTLGGGGGGFHLQSVVDTFIVSVAPSVGWPVIPAASSSVAIVVATGASVGDVVTIGTPASVPAGIMFFGWVSDTSTVSLQAYNITAATVTPVSGTYRISVRRF